VTVGGFASTFQPRLHLHINVVIMVVKIEFSRGLIW
jgi:hypothetical protein